MTAAFTGPRWLLVHTKPKQEGVAERWLGERGLSVYCPRVLEPRMHLRAPRSPVPLFASYVFCRAPEMGALFAVSFCPGVHRLIRFGDSFAAVDDRDIDLLKAREEGRGHIVIPVRPPVVGGRVRLVAEPFKGLEAVVERHMPSSERVRLLLQVASGTWHVQVPACSVRSIGLR